MTKKNKQFYLKLKFIYSKSNLFYLIWTINCIFNKSKHAFANKQQTIDIYIIQFDQTFIYFYYLLHWF